MGRNKMEKDFREKLNQRTIMPSDAAWDRLDAMLAVAEEKTKRNYTWMYIAASILGFILIAVTFFGNSQELVDKAKGGSIVVDEPSRKEKSTSPGNTVALPALQPSEIEVVAVTKPASVQKADAIDVSQKPEAQRITQKTNVLPQQEQEQAVAQAPAENQPRDPKTQQITKSLRVDADELLASVEKESKTVVPLAGKDKVKVDAGSLLSQVDGELDLTFREKAFRSVSRQYKTVKVALSNRNKE